MSEYEKNPVKIALNTGITKLYEVGVAAIEPLSKLYPSGALYFQYTLCVFGAVLAFKQEEYNDFTEWLMKNQDKLMIDYGSSEHQKALFVQMDAYFKFRVEDKRWVAKNIFSSYCGTPDKPNFPLERYNDTLLKISEEGLKYLVFLQKEILPLREAAIEKRYAEGNHPLPSAGGETKEWWIDYYRKHDPISSYIAQWLDNVYPGTVDLSKVTYAKEEYRQKEVQKKRDDFGDLQLEMEQLGLMRTYTVSGVGGWDGVSGGSATAFTPYGLSFIEFIPKFGS